VPVREGVHTVRLRFETPWQRASLAAAGLGVAAAIALYLRARRAA
jgi:hypothetical protein